jgi:Rrf2 family protein
MNVGRRVDYAVRALSYMAGQPPAMIVSRAVLEEKQDIPSYYLSKIMKDLVAAGVVRSHVGSKGGFSLARSPDQIMIKEIYEAVERPLVLMECLEKRQGFCSYCAVCTQISIWEKAQSLLANYLAAISLVDIVDRQGLRDRLVSLGG